MGFSDDLRRSAESIWTAQLQHPFVVGIGKGSLPLARFQFWLRQDYLFLIEYSRLLAFGAARAPDLATIRGFADLLHATAATEMDLHRAYAADFGVSAEALNAEEPAPVTRSYTDFLIRTAATGEFGELAAALLPCMWAFSEIGSQLARQQSGAPHRYTSWIDMYASEDFAELAAWCRALVDRLADGTSAELRRRMEEAFVQSSKYELQFWDMAWEAGSSGPG